MRARLALGLVVAGGLVAGLLLGRLSPSPDAPPVVEPASTGATPAAMSDRPSGSSSASGPDAGPPPLPPPMPAPDAPLATSWPALLARAEAGDGAAACRLAASLQGCRHHALWTRYHRMAERLAIDRIDIAGASLTAAIENAASDASTPAWVDAHCADPDGTLEARSVDLLLRLARTGDPEAMLMYVNLGQQAGHALMLTHEQRRAWREQAPALAERLLDAGHMEGASLRLGRTGANGAQRMPLGLVQPELSPADHQATMMVLSAYQSDGDAVANARRVRLWDGVDREALVERVAYLEARLGPRERRRPLLHLDPALGALAWGHAVEPVELAEACEARAR